MLWCGACRQFFDEGINECPFCGGKLEKELPPELMDAAEPVWGREGEGDPEWPVDENGETVSPVLLTHLKNTQMNVELKSSLLKAYGIPVLYAYPESGELVKLLFGFTGAGVDLYVPESCLEDAKNLLTSEEEQ